MTAGAGALGGAVWGASGTGAGAGAASAGTSMAGASLLRILGPIGLVLAPTTLGNGTLPPEVWAEAARKQEQAKTQSQAKTRDIATTNNCRGPQDKACQQGKHSGRIQAQEDKITYIPAAVAGSAWTDLPYPPGLGKCRGYADNCRNALKALSGSDRGKKFQEGADVAHKNMVGWMAKITPMGVSANPTTFKISFYFNGNKGSPSKARSSLKGKDSRRLDFDVLKGDALKG